jgi:WXG100 family type VII secretion target
MSTKKRIASCSVFLAGQVVDWRGAGIAQRKIWCDWRRFGHSIVSVLVFVRFMRGVMADHVKVDPIDLHMSSDHMDMHHAELLGAHTAADGAIEEAQAGWVGASAAALQSKLAEWQSVTSELCTDIAGHGEAFRSAATGYETTDTDSAEKLNDQL